MNECGQIGSERTPRIRVSQEIKRSLPPAIKLRDDAPAATKPTAAAAITTSSTNRKRATASSKGAAVGAAAAASQQLHEPMLFGG